MSGMHRLPNGAWVRLEDVVEIAAQTHHFTGTGNSPVPSISFCQVTFSSGRDVKLQFGTINDAQIFADHLAEQIAMRTRK